MKFEGIHRMLVPVDFSKTAGRAYEYARGLAPCSGAEIHVVHVLDTHYLSGAMHIKIEPRDEMVEKWRAHSRDKMEQLYGRKGDAGSALVLHLKEGKPHEEILKAAEELEADLIVIGSHGRGGLERSIFGSVAEKIMKLAEVPVLLIKLKGGPGIVPE